MSEPIKPGDLVIVLRNHCCDDFVGLILTAGSVVSYSSLMCSGCWKDIGSGTLVILPEIKPLLTERAKRGLRDGADVGLPPSYLKRIPPLEELERERRAEEITA